MTPEAIEELITQWVAEELAAHNANRNLGPIMESESENGDDNGNDNGEGNGNNGNNNGNEGHGGTGGAVGLARWFEKIELVFRISICPPKYQVKYASCTLQHSALTWWNAYKRTINVTPPNRVAAEYGSESVTS
ncbi:hypothetical protein Tco_0865729 [Tanacetum coccineum]